MTQTSQAMTIRACAPKGMSKSDAFHGSEGAGRPARNRQQGCQTRHCRRCLRRYQERAGAVGSLHQDLIANMRGAAPPVRGITDMTVQPNIVLVHGAWADGSCWSGVIERLQAAGYDVTAPQFPETSLAADVARLRQVLERQDGPVIVAGHSYGGQIMTALGTDARNVAGLAYIAAFGLDEGESIGALLTQGPPTPGLAHLGLDS